MEPTNTNASFWSCCICCCSSHEQVHPATTDSEKDHESIVSSQPSINVGQEDVKDNSKFQEFVTEVSGIRLPRRALLLDLSDDANPEVPIKLIGAMLQQLDMPCDDKTTYQIYLVISNIKHFLRNQTETIAYTINDDPHSSLYVFYGPHDKHKQIIDLDYEEAVKTTVLQKSRKELEETRTTIIPIPASGEWYTFELNLLDLFDKTQRHH